MPWRGEDEILLQRLEDEELVFQLFGIHLAAAGAVAPAAGAAPGRALHARAAGLIAELRRLPAGTETVALAVAGDVMRLVRFVDALPLRDARPELLHHLALFHARVAASLDAAAPELAASAWVRSLAAWLALAEERAYLARLEESVLGDAGRGRAGDVRIPPERVPLELVADVARRAEESARDLGSPGRAALLALSRTEEAARLAGASPAAARRARVEAERRRNAAIESALAVIAEGLDEANARGELAANGGILLLRALAVWTWTASDEAVEHFVVERVDKIGWELYRAKRWDSLRYLLDPFRPMFESLASRIERDPGQIAYASVCAQMFVFMSEVEAHLPQKIVLAERAVRICPTHRNGRLVLAAFLCEAAIDAMKRSVLFARREELGWIEASLARAESLYPQSTALPDAKTMLERVKKGAIKVG